MVTVVFDQPAAVVGDQVIITATVDGRPVTVGCWRAYLLGLPTKAARQSYVAGLLRDAAAAAGAPVQTVDLSGTVTI